MLTGKQVRVRYVRDRVLPCYLDASEAVWHDMAERLVEVFRGLPNRTRGELEVELDEAFGETTTQLIHQGLAKLLEDRCEFEVQSDQPPDQLREAVFRAGTAHRQTLPVGKTFDRAAVLTVVAGELGVTVEQIEHGLFADLRSEQRLVKFKDISAEHLLQRYNVALAQSVLLRSTGVQVVIRHEPPQRYRQLLRLVKFHRLVCDFEPHAGEAYLLRLDGPLSLFSATQKYGLQLALFLPALLQCKDFELKAELRWGTQRKPKTFLLSSKDGLVSHYADTGTYVPPELAMFVELFRKRVTDWDISEESDLLPLGSGFWVPDYRLLHKATRRVVYLDVLGFWRRSSVEKHLQRLRDHATAPFVLAVSEQLKVEEALEGLSAGVYRFRQMPLVDEVVKLAEQLLTTRGQQP